MDVAVLIGIGIGVIGLLLGAAQVYYGRLSVRATAPSPPSPTPSPIKLPANAVTHTCYYLLIDAHPGSSMRVSDYGWGDRSSENVRIDGQDMYFDASDFDRPHVFVLKNFARGVYPVTIKVVYVNNKPPPSTHVADLVLGDDRCYRMRWQPAVIVEPSREEHLQITPITEAELKTAMGPVPVPNCASTQNRITYTN